MERIFALHQLASRVLSLILTLNENIKFLTIIQTSAFCFRYIYRARYQVSKTSRSISNTIYTLVYISYRFKEKCIFIPLLIFALLAPAPFYL